MITKKNMERVNKIDSYVISHKNIDHAINVIEQSILLSASSVEPQNVVLFGEAGTGKTTACEAILSKRKRKFIKKNGKEIIQVPAFYCLVPSPVTTKGVAASMLKAIGDPTPTKGISLDLTNRLGKLLKECETEVIILDELQHLLMKAGVSIENSVNDWLKTLINDYKVPVIAVGTPDCRSVINSCGQLARRFTRQCELKNLDFGVDPTGEYRQFIIEIGDIFIEELKFESFPDFQSRDNALAVYISTGGNPADTMQLFKAATLNALSSKRENVELKDFENALDSLTLPSFLIGHTGNPFRYSPKKFDKAYRKL